MREVKSRSGGLAVILLLVLAGWAAARPAAGDESPLQWRPTAAGLRGRGVAALALDPGGDRLAVGDDQGALIGRPGQSFRRVLHRGPVRDLAFLPDGALLAATDRGLYRVDRDGSSTPIPTGPGAGARAAQRIASVPGLLAVAAGDGLFVSRDALAWHRLSGALPAGAVTAVALLSRGEVVVCWAVVGGELWRVDLRLDAAVPTAAAAARETIPFATLDGGAVDIAAGLPEAALVVVFPQVLALRRAGAAGERWEIVHPELPPGGRAHRVGRAAGRYWLATDRGLLEAAQLAGPWRRTPAPAGTSAIAAAAGDEEAIFAAASDGVLAGRAMLAAKVAASSPPAPGTGSVGDPPVDSVADPAVARVHRAAIHYLGLSRSRMEELRRGAKRRGWWPIAVLRGGAAWDRSRNVDYDQSFVSGAMHYLTDRARDRGDDFEVSLTLSWDFSDLAYEPESIDVSREAREVIELRDDVLDEITQLYFERRRVLAALRAPGGLSDAESTSLRLRADELAAGIDAWTGGWFGGEVSALAP